MPQRIKKAISEATDEELRQYLRDAFGTNHPPHTKRDTTLTAIRQEAPTLEHIVVTTADAPVEQAAPAAPAVEPEHIDLAEVRARIPEHLSSKEDPRITIQLNEQEGPGGDRAVPVMVNGVAMLIPRNRAVAIPYRYYLALDAARGTTYEQDENTGDISAREVLRYPFNVVQQPSREAVEAWYAKQGAVAPSMAA